MPQPWPTIRPAGPDNPAGQRFPVACKANRATGRRQPRTEDQGARTPPSTSPADDEAKLQFGDQATLRYLMKEYATILEHTKDRLAAASRWCAWRIPRRMPPQGAPGLLKTEKDPLVLMVCWQCVLARANGMSDADFNEFFTQTVKLADAATSAATCGSACCACWPCRAGCQGQGDLQFDLHGHQLHRQAGPGDAQRHGRDDEGLGRWVGSGGAALATRGHQDAPGRVNPQAAGCPVNPASLRWSSAPDKMWQLAQQITATGGRRPKPTGRSAANTKRTPRKLDSLYVPRVNRSATVDPEDKDSHKDLEMRTPHLKTFSVGLIVDTTGSMGPVLVWLRSDIKHNTETRIGFVAPEPRNQPHLLPRFRRCLHRQDGAAHRPGGHPLGRPWDDGRQGRWRPSRSGARGASGFAEERQVGRR